MNHVGCYQTSISVPSSWEGRRHFLVFEGVSAAFHCWLDGEFVGYSSDSFCPTEFDVTRFVRAGGEHVLSVRVLRYCEGSYMESQVFISPSTHPTTKAQLLTKHVALAGHVVALGHPA